MTRAQILKRDNLLVDFIFQHKGINQIVSSKEISEYLNSKGFPIQQQGIHTAIRDVIFERRLPICSLNGKGYYWAITKKIFRKPLPICEEE